MKLARRQKLLKIIFFLVLLALVVMLVLYALRQNISFFYTPTQIAEGEAPVDRLIRVGGMVVKGSVKHDAQSLHGSFELTDFKQQITVTYNQVLPDLFREGQGVVAKGRMNSQHEIEAVEVLAKHDEKYMPPEVNAMLGAGKRIRK